MNALLFPGQGSQVVGMGSELFKNYQRVKDIFKEADDKLNYSISKIILGGPGRQISINSKYPTSNFTVSYSIFKVLKEEYNYNLENFKYLLDIR